MSSRPPKAGAPLPAELSAKLTEAAAASLTAETGQDRFATVLDALAFSPVRTQVVPAGIPAEPSTELLAAVKKVAYKGGNIIIEHSGFQYSANKFVIKKKPGYKGFAALKMRTCKQTKPALPGPNVLKQRAGACPAGYKG